MRLSGRPELSEEGRHVRLDLAEGDILPAVLPPAEGVEYE